MPECLLLMCLSRCLRSKNFLWQLEHSCLLTPE